MTKKAANQDGGVIWEDPPAGNSTARIKHHEISAELRAHPGQWAKVAVTSQRTATDIKRGQLAAYRPAGSFEAVSRNARPADDGRKTLISDIYARYIGEDR